LEEAESNLQKAIQIRPEYAEPYFHLALLLEARGDLAGAKRNYARFVELANGISADFLFKVQKRFAALATP
jgi:Flp pilus assembly protein TadD